MADKIVVLGAGYAGVRAVKQLEVELADIDADLVWVSKTDYHLMLHEIHRVICDPNVQAHLKLPIEEIKSPATRFIKGEVVGLDTDAREITLADGSIVDYDYVLICLGSQTAFYGIKGLEEHALTLKSLDNALVIHEAINEAAQNASEHAPAQIVIGGAGFTGIQSAGEIAKFRDIHHLPIEIILVDASEEIHPDPDMRAVLRDRLLERGIEILTDARITEIDESMVHFEGRPSRDYNRLLWAGGITGQDALTNTDLENEHNRMITETTFETSDEHVFAVGDAALIEQDNKGVVPSTAEAAWEGAEVAGTNLARAFRGDSLETWSYTNEGMLVSIGSATVAHNVKSTPISTFSGPVARFLKKAISARWISSITSLRPAARAWPAL